jgi:hypothetical protein
MEAQTAVGPSPSRTRIEFFTKTVKNEAKTREAGRPIHDSVVFIRKTVPGAQSPFEREKWESDEREFSAAWRAYLEQREIPLNGTRIEDWGILSAEQVADYKAVNIRTIEEVATLNDGQVHMLGLGAMALREQAKVYLAAAKDKTLATVQAGEIETLRQEVSELKALVKEQANEIKKLREEPVSKKR